VNNAQVDWLVIAADRSGAGRGVSGYTLASFLQTYFGRRSVRLISPDTWRQRPVSADTLCVGLPTSLVPEELVRLQCRRLITFDYLDRHELAWTLDQQDAVRERVQAYLKPWRESAWTYDFRMGLLPIRRYARLSVALQLDRFLRPLLEDRWSKKYDVAFIGRPNVVDLFRSNAVCPVEQRVQWLLGLRRDAPDLRVWGGLIGIHDNPKRLAQLTEQFGDVAALEHSARKVSFPDYYMNLCRSRVVLAPGGNVPWSYRHYEALYSRAVVVTIDFREREMLVPLPNDGMVHVPDDASVVPAVREALEWSRTRPELGKQNMAHLEQYFRHGSYSRRRPELMRRFLEQLC
jgi:hypothetical protein